MKNTLNRRDFLSKASIYSGTMALTMNISFPLAAAAAAKSQIATALTPSEWCVIEAITSRIIPTDDTPGAKEANCVNFIDKALTHEEKASLGFVQNSISALTKYCIDSYKEDFCDSNRKQQDAVLQDLENNRVEGWPSNAGQPAQFFGLVRAFTIFGYLADPKYGGNRDYIGWQTAGYPGPRHHRGGYTDKEMKGEELIHTVWDTI